MRYACFALCLFLGSCSAPEIVSESGIKVEKHDVLSPSDLNIQKMRFSAHPSKGEVAIFRSRHWSALDSFDQETYDQIFWSNGEIVSKDLIVADRSFYVDFEKPKKSTSANAFRKSWRLHAGLYSYDIDDYSFVRSSFGERNKKAVGELVYTKNTGEESEDLVFEFTMFIVTLEEAKRIHPKLKIDQEEKTQSWSAAYRIRDFPPLRASGNKKEN